MKRTIKFSPPDISEKEIENVVETLKSGWITTGPKTKLLEEKIASYCGTNKAVCLNSATACLEMTLRLLGIGPGDEVITSAYTYTASCSVICHVGAKPILIDTQENSFEMDYEKLEKAITPNTKAVIPVDLGGVMCDYDTIFKIIEKKKNIFKPMNGIQEAMGRVAVVADGAHSFGACRDNKRSGSVADFTCFSFHAVKNLTTAEGGAVTWLGVDGISDEEIYKNFMLLSLHGQNKDALSKLKAGCWEYDIIWPAYKCNMTDIHAAIGLSQLERYDDILKKRRETVKKYNDAFADENIAFLPHLSENSTSCCHLYIMRLLGKTMDFRNKFIENLALEGVASNVHYKPLPMLTAYKNMGFDINNYKNAYRLFENEVTLPLHNLLTSDDVDYVIEKVKENL